MVIADADGSYISHFDNSIVGLAERAPRPSISAYPNPTNGPLTIVPGNPDVQRLEVIDATGRITGSYAVQGADRIVLETAGWSAGAYHYRCLDGDGAPLVQGNFVVVD